MKTEIKQRWLEALRDGKRKQGKHYLKDVDDTFCPLGVLCDLYNNSLWQISTKEPIGLKEHYSYMDSECFIPEPVRNWAGNIDFSSQMMIANMNDNSGYSFQDIANWIEKGTA